MDKAQLDHFLSLEIKRAMHDNADVFTAALSAGVTNDDSVPELIGKVSLNAIRVATQLACRIIIDGLESGGYIQLRDHPLPDLRIVPNED